MQIGVGSFSYRWAVGIGDAIPPVPLTPADLVRRTHAHGLSLLQIADNLPLHRQPEAAIAEFDATARELGVRIELGLAGLSPAGIETYLRLAQRLDANLIRISPDRADAARPVAELAAQLRSVAAEAKRAGVTLAVENHFHLPSPKLLEVIKAVGDPAVGICLDVANSIAVEEWPTQTIELLAPHAVNLHLKDYRIAIDPHGVGMSFTGTPLGEGRLDIAGVFAALARHGRDVSVIIEHWLPRAATLEETLAAEEAWLETSIRAARLAIDAAENRRNRP